MMDRRGMPLVAAVLVLVVAAAAGAVTPLGPCQTPPKPPALPPATIERVSDGDTVVLRFPDGRRERTRLIGIDTPEVHESAKLERDAQRSGRDRAAIQALGREAAAFTAKLLPRGTTVEVEEDVQARDRYGRLLAYLWSPDGSMVNLTIMRDGYAQVLTVPPNVRYQALFVACQREARSAGRGLWSQR